MSDIDDKHLQLGGDTGFLGKAKNPGDPEKNCPDGKGRFREYEKGVIYSGPGGVHELHGAILDKWNELNAEAGKLGYPTTDHRHVNDGVGRYAEFEKGAIYWSPATGAHDVVDVTGIWGKYRIYGGPRGVLGYPTSDTAPIKDGRFNNFEHGAIYWRGATSAFVVHGEIHGKWIAQGGVNGKFGFPRSDELPSPDINLRFNKFENGQLTRTITPSTPLKKTDIALPVREAHDLTLDKLKSNNKTNKGDGFRILGLSLYGDTANPLYTGLWVKDGGPEQKVLFKASKSELQTFLDDPANDGFHPTIISATGPSNKAVFALVCEKRKGAAPVLRSRLVSGPIDKIYTPDTFAYWCRWAKANHHILRCVAIYGDQNEPRYAGIWELNSDEVPWNVAYHNADKKIVTNFLAETAPELFEEGEMQAITHAQAFWARPAFATRSPHGHELRIFRADRVVDWALRKDTLEEYVSDLKKFKGEGFVPVCAQGAQIDGKSRFSVIFAKRVQPQPRKLTITGKHTQSLVAFDEAMGDMVKSTGARAASLAIAKDGRLVYARAFTWAEADQPAVEPTQLFRIASCSKPITSVGIYQLDEDKKLDPKNGGGLLAEPEKYFLKSNVTLTLPLKTSLAPNFDSIRLNQVLMHTAGFRKPIFKDEKVLEAFDKAKPPLKGIELTMPMTMLQVASHMATVPLELEPGKEFHYSNVGFLFLTLLLEQRLGKPYEQALQERIFQKVGVKRAQITSSSPELKQNEVIALDPQLRVGRSVMEKERPIVAHEYGTINRNTRPGTGGWMMAPADYVRFLSVLHSGDGTLLKPETVKNGARIKSHGGGIDGAVAHVEHMDSGFTFAVFFAINFFGEYETRIRDIINALPAKAWPTGDLFPTLDIK